jgi:adenosylcobinamide-GDP ribazoletransferase
MKAELGKLAHALGFFTRLTLPDPVWRHAAPWRLDQCARWFPACGLLIGIVPALVWLVATQWLPPVLAAGLAVAAAIVLTGALHEDGLGDTADGLFGAHSRERALEIMRDSAIGTYGAAALIFSIGLRWAALASLAPSAGAAALVIAHIAARGSIAVALNLSPYARKNGTGALVSHGISGAELARTLAIAGLLALLFGSWAGLLAAIAGVAAAALLHMRISKRLGGYTGDTLGAMEQVCEIVILVVLAANWRIA